MALITSDCVRRRSNPSVLSHPDRSAGLAVTATDDECDAEEFRLVEKARWDAAMAARVAESAQRQVDSEKLAVEEAAAAVVAAKERAALAAEEAVAAEAAAEEAARLAAVAAEVSAATKQAERVRSAWPCTVLAPLA